MLKATVADIFSFSGQCFAKRLGRRIGRAAAAVLLLACASPLPVAAHEDPGRGSSRLASGNWVKIPVKTDGIHKISDAQLRAMGFPDPEKVNVYGFGGRMIPEDLTDGLPSDLPPAPSLRIPGALLFFGQGTVGWEPGGDWLLKRSHVANPYSESSFYFLSDSDSGSFPYPATQEHPADTIETRPAVTSFVENIVHEKDLTRPSAMGRTLLGEDFRGKPTQTFRFQLPGNTGDARIRIVFGTKVTNGSSSILVTANGSQLTATTDDRFPQATSSETFLVLSSTSKKIEGAGDKLDLTLSFSHSGNLVTAALDFIEVEYERRLHLAGTQLVFTSEVEVPSLAVVTGEVAGAVVWDITDLQATKVVPASANDRKLTFPVAQGERRYVVFNPKGNFPSPESHKKIANQDLRAMNAPDLLVVAPPAFTAAAKELAALRTTNSGLAVETVTPEQVYNEFSSGTPDLSAFRLMLRRWMVCQEGKVPMVLLMGRASNDPKGTARGANNAEMEIPIYQSPEGFTSSTSYSTDDFIAMLDPGPFSPAKARIHAAVGRWPVRTESQALESVGKLRFHEANTDPGPWRNQILIVADDQDNGQHLLQAERMATSLEENPAGRNSDISRLYLDTYPLQPSATGPAYPAATKDLLDKWNRGLALISYIGHANAREWGHEKLLTATNINSLHNTRLPFLYAATCDFLAWDLDDTSGGENLWLKPESGIIGALCPSRKVFIPLNAAVNEAFASNLFKRTPQAEPLPIGEVVRLTKNSLTGDNRLRYALLADPSSCLPSPRFEITFDSIGENLPEGSELPVLAAGETVALSGTVSAPGPNRTVQQDFSGTVFINLFDAESPVQTLGNGADGKILTFNDRGQRLLQLRASAANGKWKAKTAIPTSIAQNFNNARLSGYAVDSAGNEAHGATTSFILYGTDPDSSTDTEGPEIKEFHINGPLFSDGDPTGPAISVHALISDPSGLNTVQSESGRSLTAVLDQEAPLFLGDSFEPETDDFTTGRLDFTIDKINPGRHSLTLEAWDNAGNCTARTLEFRVNAAWRPGITGISASAHDGNGVFLVQTDGIPDDATCEISIFSLSGFHTRTLKADRNHKTGGTFTVPWDLRDRSGKRVTGGIYPFLVTVSQSSGRRYSESSKIAVTPP